MKERNYGIDALRILSMLMVVILHVFGQGGVLNAAEPQSTHYWIAWFMEIACYCAVNCFAIISGFVMYRSKPRLSKVFNLWSQTIFYTILISIIFLIIRPDDMNILKALVNSILPITRNHYWYITSYFGLLILLPLLNTSIAYMSQKTFAGMLLSISIFFIIFPTCLFSDAYRLEGGYSLMWLVLLYLLGAYISKYNIPHQIKGTWAWIVLICSFLVTFVSKYILETFPEYLPISIGSNVLITYNSPTIVLIAIALLIICSKQKFSKTISSIIHVLSPAALGVYLIHTNQLIWKYLITDCAKNLVNYHWSVMICLVLLLAVIIYIICTTIELLRIQLFRLLKINNLFNKIEARLTQIIHQHIHV